MDWPGTEVRFHSYIGDITVDGHLWRGVGVLGAVESNGAAGVAQRPVITLKLVSLPESAAEYMVPAGVRGRRAELFVGAKDPARDDLSLIGGIYPEFGGSIGAVKMQWQEPDESGVRRFDYSVEVAVGRSPRLPLTYYDTHADRLRRTADDLRGPDTAFRHLAANAATSLVWTPT